jgi:type III secretion protein R
MNQSMHPYWLVIVAVGLATAPMIVGLATSYLKVSVVLGVLRTGLGTQDVPSNLVTMTLSLAITLFIMSPVLQKTAAVSEQIDFGPVLKTPSLESLNKVAKIVEPWKEFITMHAGQREVELLSRTALSKQKMEQNKEQAQQVATDPTKRSFSIVLIAFVLTELKEALIMAFLLLVPFLVIDLIVSNILVGLGMFMVSPVMISLPLKIILFVLADGWLVLTQGLVSSYGVLK